ncbi:MAG: SMI1/KNR4 family protein [Reinekea sp.]
MNIDGWVSENKKITNMVIDNVERTLGVKLPSAYIQLMTRWNGGGFPESYQILIEGDVPENLKYYLGDGFWELNQLAGISGKDDSYNSIIYTAQTAHEWGIPREVIAFDGDGHTWLAFDYRDSIHEPKIIFIESDEFKSFDISRNFRSFIERLIPSNQVYDHDGNLIYRA